MKTRIISVLAGMMLSVSTSYAAITPTTLMNDTSATSVTDGSYEVSSWTQDVRDNFADSWDEFKYGFCAFFGCL